ncbi:sensor histidine kinase [Larkinella sp. VNQ87]|uniref:sensor histidine kinase n=1 Tax=Larkinella sp. VNQ87 TaxID=3400921 RepID=UPI003C10218C
MHPVHPYSIPFRGRFILLGSLAITLLFALPRLALLSFASRGGRIDFSWAEFGIRSLYSFLIAVLFLLVNLHPRWSGVSGLPKGINRHLMLGLVNAGLLAGIDSLFIRLHLSLFEPPFNERLFRFFFRISMVLEVLLVVLVAYLFRLTFHNQQVRIANERLLKVNAETRYELLKNQVNPHFLFNSLNTVNALILHDPVAASRFVSHLSDVFRYTLTSRTVDLVTLEEEMQFMESYLAMLTGRYGEKVRFELAINPICHTSRLPPMALQMLVENAIKHNVASSRQPLRVRLATNIDHTLTVTNGLQVKKDPELSTGLGLANLNQRCLYLSGREIRIQKTADTFSVTVPLLP